MFCAALLASLSVHLPVYEVLGTLAKVWSEKEATERPKTVEFELAPLDEEVAKLDRKPVDQKPLEAPAEHVERTPLAKKAEPKEKPKPDVPEPKKKIDLNVVHPPPQPAPPPPPPAVQNKLAVVQKSDDPNAPPPDDPKFIAEENRRVEQETVASVTNLQEDDPETQLTPNNAPETDTPGNSEKSDPADLQNVKGDPSRIANVREANEKPLNDSSRSRGEEKADAVTPSPLKGGAQNEQPERKAVAAGSPTNGGEEQELVINDGMGTIRIPRTPKGQGAGDQGGGQTRGSANGQTAQRGARQGRGANLQLSWSQFEQTFGSHDLEEQREAYLEQRRSQSRGGGSEAQWKKFRAAIENFVPNVKSGNQTALNAAASPFATYLNEVHRRIHREFAMRFLRDLPLVGGPYNDYDLYTKLEIVINGDGTLHRVGVVQSSGFLPFDYGAWNSVDRAAPFPEPPRKIMSGDGRVYFRWGFYRNEKQCGTFNAEPYILPSIGVPPKPGPMQDSPGDDSKLGMTAPSPTQRVARAGE